MVKVKIDMNKLGFLIAQGLAREAPKQTSTLARSFTGTLQVSGTKISFRLPEYANSVINGSPPHTIEVKDANILAVPISKWQGINPNKYGSGKFPMLSKDGRFVLLGKKVKHPGNAPNPFIESYLRKNLKNDMKQSMKIIK